MKLEDFKIGDRVVVGVGEHERTMEVYEEMDSDGCKYLALKSLKTKEFNGSLEKYLEGFWGGVQRKL